MNHVFVWRLEDVFGLVLMGLVLIVGSLYGLACLADRVKRWWKRTAKHGEGNGNG